MAEPLGRIMSTGQEMSGCKHHSICRSTLALVAADASLAHLFAIILMRATLDCPYNFVQLGVSLYN